MAPNALTAEHVPHLHEWQPALDRRLADADGLLLCSDFDGTLTTIESDHDDPGITPGSREALRELAARPNVDVAIVSGRQLSDLRSRVGLDGVVYAGNHGLELERDGAVTVHPIASKLRPTIQRLCEVLEDRLAEIDGALVENKGVTATIHYRRVADGRVSDVHAVVAAVVDRYGGDGVRTTPGKQIVEIRPDIPWDKGHAVQFLAAERPQGWLTMYIGDDATDEDAFEAINPDGVGVHVGERADTAAHCRTDSPTAVEQFLDWLRVDGVARLG